MANEYSRISDVPDNLRMVAPTLDGQAVKLSLAQINVLASFYNKYKNNNDNAHEKAKAEFRKAYIIKDGKWVKTMPEKLDEINEMWLKMPGSYEEVTDKINAAVRSNYNKFAAKEKYHISVDATFSNMVIVSVNDYDNGEKSSKYYRANWSENADGEIEFDDIEEITVEVAVKKVNECKELVEQVRAATNTVELNETILTNVVLDELEVGGKKILCGKIPIAQRAEVRNGNGRKYRANALKEATADAKKTIEKYGALRMEGAHYLRPDGKNDNQIIRTAALIKDINWHEDTKTVSLDEVELVPELEQGHAVKALLERGYKLQVSQRAVGSSNMSKEDDGTFVEDVYYVKFQGWDFLPGGEASVGDASFEVITEGIKVLGKVLSENEVKTFVEGAINDAEQRITQTITEGITTTLKETGLLVEPEASKNVKPKDERIDSLLLEIKSLNERLDNGEKVTTELKKEKEVSYLRQYGQNFLETEIKKDAYKRFNEDQKKRLVSYIDPTELYGQVDIVQEEPIRDKLLIMLTEEMVKMDANIADLKLKELGVMDENGQIKQLAAHGIARVDVLNEPVPNMAEIVKLQESVEKRMDLIMPTTELWAKDHACMKFVNEELMPLFYEQNHRRLLNEANEEVTQSDIGLKVATIAAAVIPVAFRAMKALPLMDVGTMRQKTLEIPVASWNPARTGDIATDMGVVMIAEKGTVPTRGIQYAAAYIYSTRKAMGTYVTSEAIATSRGSSMNPVSDSLAYLTKDLADLKDQWFFNMMLAAAQMQPASITSVSSPETLTQVGATNEWASAYQGWIKYEWLRTLDANGNPTAAVLNPLYGAGAASTLYEPVVVSDNLSTAYTYATHYTVNWADGTVTLTTAGLAVFVGAGATSLTAVYSYDEVNTKFWSITPAAGITLYDHLVNLRYMIARARTLVRDRHYTPGFIAMNFDIEDLIAAGPQFTEAGKTPADMINRMMEVLTYAGMETVSTSGMPAGWVVSGEKGGLSHRIQMPWKLSGPTHSVTTGYDHYDGEEFSGEDMPVKDKFAAVGITDLNT